MSRSRTQSFVFLPFVLVLVAVLLPSLSQAQTTGIVTFGVLRNLEFIDQFYDGGKGSLGSGPGPNFGLTFTSTAQTITSASKGGSGRAIGVTFKPVIVSGVDAGPIVIAPQVASTAPARIPLATSRSASRRCRCEVREP